MTTSSQTNQLPKLSFWEIWNMSFGFFGIQMGFALQIGNTSRIFQTLSADVDSLAIYWLAGSITGLLVQPVIGYLSDRTWYPKLGRRRPYFLIGALLASLALLIMPNSPTLWIAIGMLWIMDASFNISMEPFRAFVGDKLPTEQRTRGFAMQSFFIGIGAVIASLLPWFFANVLNISNTAPEGIIPPSVKWSYYIGAIAFIMAVGWTVFKSREYSPEELKKYLGSKNVEEKSYVDAKEYADNGKKHLTWGLTLFVIGIVTSYLVYSSALSHDLYVLCVGIGFFGILAIISGRMQITGHYKNGFITMAVDIQSMPKTMKQLALVQFFSWFALFAMWIYTTPAITEFIYHSTDTTSQAYNDGADWVNISFGVYNGVAALVAFLLPVLAARTSRRFTHMLSLVAGGIGLMSIYFIHNPNMLLVSMIGVGVAWPVSFRCLMLFLPVQFLHRN